MRCSHCGLCCTETEMLLSEADVRRLIKDRIRKKHFTKRGNDGYLKLRNKRGYCFFYDTKTAQCSAYRSRPEGCRLYPIVMSIGEGIVVDDLCPMKDSIGEQELRKKGERVVKLLSKIDKEAADRRRSLVVSY